MRERWATILTAAVVIMALSIPAGAVELHGPHQGMDACKGTRIETLHFVNNQLRDYDGAVYLWIQISGGPNIGPLLAEPHPSANKHWWVDIAAGQVLVNAWTTTTDDPAPSPITSDGPGKLVLSDYKCKTR